MREAFGGTFTIQLILIFLALYISFIAVALNYTKAFRIKNSIIDIIEQNEGIPDWNDENDNARVQINNYLNRMSYYVTLDNINNLNKDNMHCFQQGYCIEEFDAGPRNGLDRVYYRVTTYMRIEIPFLRIDFTTPIMGETKIIERLK